MSFELRINEKILSILKENKELNILAISSSLDMDRHTVAKYLEVLRTKGLVTFSTKGKSKFWRLSDNSFTELLGVNDFISNQVLELFSNLDYEVSVQSKNYDVVWNNKNKEGGKCYRVLKGKETRCKHCPSEKVFETGILQKSIIKVGGEEKLLIAQPIKNEEGVVVAVVELIKGVNN